MTQTTTNKLSQYFTPQLVIIPAISSRRDILLNEVVRNNPFVQQSKFINDSKYIEINTTDTNLSIEAVRELITTLSYGTYKGELQVLLVYNLDSASVPAQNALLKLLEEPPQHTLLFVTASTTEAILPTILSRCVVVYPDLNDAIKGDFDTSQYISIYSNIMDSSTRELIDLAQNYSERPAALSLVNGLTAALHIALQSQPTDTTFRTALHALVQSQKQLQQNANTKLVLEHLFFRLRKLL